VTTGYRLSPAARDDLSAIWDYTAQTWGIAKAEQYVLSIHGACQAIAEGRKQGQTIDDIRPGYRKLAVGAHVLFFRAAETGGIDVIRILHQRMDVLSRLQGG
jgi:toxin ParE1/3/4